MDTTFLKIIDIIDIPTDMLFEGYYWYSDKSKPTCIVGEPIYRDWFTDLPFVVEANFYAPAEHISLQVRNIDGQYKFIWIDLNKVQEGEAKTYIGHDLGGRFFKLIEVWTEGPPDPLLEGMRMLLPSWSAFVGFTSTLK